MAYRFAVGGTVVNEDPMESKNEIPDSGERFVLCDWGSSHLRATLVTKKMVLYGWRSDQGSKALAGRAEGYRAELSRFLDDIGGSPELEIRISGMAGSKVGWLETGYLPTPVGVADFKDHYWEIPEFPNLRLYGGVSHENPDGSMEVMRGEEFQIFGLLREFPDAKIVCLPGTHSKWVRIEEGKISSFQTVMTGDLFHALSEATIFREQITSKRFVESAFLAGCSLAMEGNDLNDLFKLRSAFVFSKVQGDEFHSYLSGFLIANEIRVAEPGEAIVYLCGSSHLVERYALVMEKMGVSSEMVDGENAAISGHRALLSI